MSLSIMRHSVLVLVYLQAAIIIGGVESSEVRLGEDPISRSYVDSAEHMLIISDIDTQSTVTGEVRGFEFHSRNTNEVEISVWRHQNGEDFRYVGGVNITPSHSGRNDVTLNPSQYIPIEVGDVLGISFRNGGVIDFDTTSCGYRPHTRVVWGPDQYTSGQIVTFIRSDDSSWGPCRHYSVRAVIQERASGDDDPAFVVSESATKSLCFPYVGSPSHVMPLVVDQDSGLVAGGRVSVLYPDIDGVTSFSDIDMKTRMSTLSFNSDGYSINMLEYSWSSFETHYSGEFILRPIALANIEAVELTFANFDHWIVVTRKEGSSAGHYLDFQFVDRVSPQTQGRIGQYVDANFRIHEENGNHFASINLFHGDVTVPVSSELGASATARGKLTCWL